MKGRLVKPRVSRNIKLFLFIACIFFVSLYIALPSSFPVVFSTPSIAGKSFSVDRTIIRPPIDFSLGSLRVYRDLEWKMGLDIQGGTRVSLTADMQNIPKDDRADALESAREIISRRVDMFGVSEAVVRTSMAGDQYRLIVEMPGLSDSNQALNLIGTTAQLDFRENPDDSIFPDPASPSATIAWISSFSPTDLTGKDLKKSSVQYSTENGQPVVSLVFTEEGKKKFAEITQRNVGKPVGIFLDGFPVTVPNVNEPILNGEAVISGGFTEEGAKELSVQLNAGALPVPIIVEQQESIGASLGNEAVNQTFLAGLLGVGVVMVFMILLYGWRGVIADLALVMYALITVALYKLIPVTLSLPGLAGLLLSIGMAVDSNILIFERMKEEMRAGRPFKQAMELGFGRAWDSIKDANTATLFTCFILFNPLEWDFLSRSGMVRGFALTLALGIVVSLFTGIVVTRTLLRLFLRDDSLKRVGRDSHVLGGVR
ncbi:MAG: Preprotein translocase subunit SecD [Microgenomates group bacterium GW2011_GWF2_45_18]|nr:MAG: Preprotein translocase subunit SecD [Microgenomates group bacterium GW2011_GWF2_45_18]OGJ41385.1 MAG: protein-export membrane protein SecD [Candidatus Pacebacteria bacterium RIFOXYB1_FULL_44_10]HAU98650.1 protein translocase subunit SecD [Candidatus Paceibacterota bacterium]HAX01924.1 protein translocase subunit SecD [Candidatus Paceibacterota bacterium]